MYTTPVSNRLHIGIFGRRNVGKSSLINAVTGQRLAIVSEVAGTTTDPVGKSMEILPIGPCMIIDTAGLDDTGVLGQERIEKTLNILRKTDVAIIVVDSENGFGNFESHIINLIKEKSIPFFFVINKLDKANPDKIKIEIEKLGFDSVCVSSKTKQGIEDLKFKIIEKAPKSWAPFPLVRDIVKPKDTVVLVCPIDAAMPQGRLILPEVQVLRDVLDADAKAFVTKDTELFDVLNSLKKKPDLVITDSQAFGYVKNVVPCDVRLTSFSVVYARHKGELDAFIKGVNVINSLKDTDTVLVAEACTHHVQGEDIGRVKIPAWIREKTGKKINFEVCAGGDFPNDLKKYKLVISCGGCMINRKEMLYRIEKCRKENVPITNYGILIAYVFDMIDRVVAPFLSP
ncbi:[FeFe] hydrogenase H-cluster maturation GTPase HydF [bacterium]|nr:[FeFe] hydrogenase H-cluster maturation GTPase HydF [bacterium]